MSTTGNPMDAVNGARDRLLRLEDVAERLSISRSMAWKLVANREISSIRIGRAVRIRPEDLEAFIDGASEDA